MQTGRKLGKLPLLPGKQTHLPGHAALSQHMGLRTDSGDFPGVQWLGFSAFTAEGAGSIPGQRTKIL